MEFYKIFLQILRIFWLTSRLFLGLVFFYSAYFVLEAPEASDYYVAGFFAVFATALLWIFFSELFRGGANKWIKIFSGSISIILATLMGFATVQIIEFDEFFASIFIPIGLFLTGLCDLISIKLNSGRNVSPEFSEVEL